MVEEFDLEHLRMLSKDKDKQGFGPYSSHYGCNCGNDLAKAADEIERLCAILDQFSKTADGLPATPGMTLWMYSMPPGIGFHSITVKESTGQYCWYSAKEEAKIQAEKRDREMQTQRDKRNKHS